MVLFFFLLPLFLLSGILNDMVVAFAFSIFLLKAFFAVVIIMLPLLMLRKMLTQ